jgi:hypothetical protein
VPDELRALPAGTYVVQPAEELTTLSPEEEAGLAAALESVRSGKGIEHEAVRARVQRMCVREDHLLAGSGTSHETTPSPRRNWETAFYVSSNAWRTSRLTVPLTR